MRIRTRLFVGILLLTLTFMNSYARDLIINEFLASNDVTNLDYDGDSSDWIEIFNNSESAIQLDGYTLTDDPNNLTKWIFPAISIAANQYLVIWCSGKNNHNGELHANFQLNREGEFIAISKPDGSVVDSLTYPEQRTDISYGRFPDASNNFVAFT